MYKRYYDGYGAAPVLPRRGEIITPKCADEVPCRQEREEGNCKVHDGSKGTEECGHNTESRCAPSCNEHPLPSSDCCEAPKPKNKNLFEGIEIDDIILLAIIIVMLREGTGDSTLIIVLGAIFLFGFID